MDTLLAISTYSNCHASALDEAASDPRFNYLIVLSASFLGVGLTRLTQGIGGAIESSKTVRWYAPHTIMIVLVMMLQLQFWWASFADREAASSWNFLVYLLFLLIPFSYCQISALLVPSTNGGIYNFKHSYWLNNVRVYSIAIGIETLKIVVDLLSYGPEMYLGHNIFRMVGIYLLTIMVACQDSSPSSPRYRYYRRNKLESLVMKTGLSQEKIHYVCSSMLLLLFAFFVYMYTFVM